jgi:hypothetical protein
MVIATSNPMANAGNKADDEFIRVHDFAGLRPQFRSSEIQGAFSVQQSPVPFVWPRV